MTAAGKIRHRISLQSKIRVADGAGGYSYSWQTVGKVWAFVKPGRSHRVYENDKQTTITHHDVTIRYRDDITTEMRFLFGSRRLPVCSVQNHDGQKKWLTCLCREEE